MSYTAKFLKPLTPARAIDVMLIQVGAHLTTAQRICDSSLLSVRPVQPNERAFALAALGQAKALIEEVQSMLESSIDI